MEPNDLTTRILIEIRDGVRATNERIEQTNVQLEQTNARLDRTNDRLDGVVREQIRASTEIVAIGPKIDGLTTAVTKLGARIDNMIAGPLGSTVRDHEARITQLERAQRPKRG